MYSVGQSPKSGIELLRVRRCTAVLQLRFDHNHSVVRDWTDSENSARTITTLEEACGADKITTTSPADVESA